MSYLVTGACGCIGSWVIKQLTEAGETVHAFDLQTNTARMDLILSAEQIEGLNFIEGDITDGALVDFMVDENKIERIIHLAALQVPACKANPELGKKVNIEGTRNVFRAASRHRDQVKTVVYASSVAVYGPKEDYQSLYGNDPVLPNDAPQTPGTLYGETKKQCELDAAEFTAEDGIPRLTLRPWTVYGPGRDFGLTSGPTKAIKAAVVGRDYHIGFGHLTDLQFVADIASTFILLSRQDDFRGAKAYNIKGQWAEVSDFISLLESIVPECRGRITFEDLELAIAPKVDDSELMAEVPGVRKTPLAGGIRRSIEIFRHHHLQGNLDCSDLDE